MSIPSLCAAMIWSIVSGSLHLIHLLVLYTSGFLLCNSIIVGSSSFRRRKAFHLSMWSCASVFPLVMLSLVFAFHVFVQSISFASCLSNQLLCLFCVAHMLAHFVRLLTFRNAFMLALIVFSPHFKYALIFVTVFSLIFMLSLMLSFLPSLASWSANSFSSIPVCAFTF